jgi:hypothetical protein
MSPSIRSTGYNSALLPAADDDAQRSIIGRSRLIGDMHVTRPAPKFEIGVGQRHESSCPNWPVRWPIEASRLFFELHVSSPRTPSEATHDADGAISTQQLPPFFLVQPREKLGRPHRSNHGDIIIGLVAGRGLSPSCDPAAAAAAAAAHTHTPRCTICVGIF